MNSLRLELSSARAVGDDVVREHDALVKQGEYFEGLDLLMEKENEDDIAKLEAELADIEVCFNLCCRRNGKLIPHGQAVIKETAERTALALSKADEAQNAIDHVVSAAHYKEQVLHGDIDVISAQVVSVKADLSADEAHYVELLKSHDVIKDACLLADQEVKSLEADLARLDADTEGLRSEALLETQAHTEKMATLKRDNDVLETSHMSTLAELGRVKEAIARVEDDTRISVNTLREKQASHQAGHDKKATSLNESVATNNARIMEMKASYHSLKQDVDAKQAQLDARYRHFDKESSKYGQMIEDIMFVTREAKLDFREYESKWQEAGNRQRLAERQAVAAEKQAIEAQQKSHEMAKERSISKHAFNTQLKDLREQNESLMRSNEALAVAIDGLRADKTMLGEVIAKLEKDFEDRQRPLLFRIRRAKEDLELFSSKEADLLSQLNAQFLYLKDEETRIVTQKAEYCAALENTYDEMDSVIQMQDETADAKWAAEGQAKALEQLLLTPLSGTFDTPTFSSSLINSSPSMLATPALDGTSDDSDMIFDASFEEAQSGDIVDSATFRGLADVSVGHVEQGVGLGFVM